jgi:uncharacterized Tic20 family protein
MAKTEEIPKDEPSAETTEEEVGRDTTRDARKWAMFCHLAGLAWMTWLLPPLIGGVVAVLILWQIKKDDHPFIDENGRRAINFQLSMLIYAVALAITVIGIYLLPVVAILDIVFTIVAAIRAGSGKYYKYPLTIEFIK